MRYLPYTPQGRSQTPVVPGSALALAHDVVSWLEGLPEATADARQLSR
jgi:hypothetical protein